MAKHSHKYNFPQGEKLGMSLSLLCGVHCMITPVAVTFLPLAGGELLHDSRIEFLLLGLTAAMGLYFLRRDYLKAHRQPHALVLLLIGLALAVGGHVAEQTLLSVAGGLFLFGAFWHNFRLVRARHSCKAH